MICCAFFLSAQSPISRAYQIKAVFLFNFTQFVEWPPDVFISENEPLVIGILGEDPFGSYLDEIVAGEKVNGHPLIIQRYQNVDEIKTCHILYLNLAEASDLTNLKGRSILTVSDAAPFIQQGGMIRFFTEKNKIQFHINPDVARAEELIISSKLLRLAKIEGAR